jgi:hypothetical protein
MKRTLIPLIAAAAMLASSGAYAVSRQDAKQARQQVVQKFKKQTATRPQTTQPTNGARAVPEIDVTAGTQAGALILGSLLLVAERSRRRAARSAS